MSTDVLEKPKTKPKTQGPGDGQDGAWHVIVLNDSHNTFEGVSLALARVIPGVNPQKGYQLADLIHNSGQAIVWSGEMEIAELYWEQLKAFGLTMAPLEKA